MIYGGCAHWVITRTIVVFVETAWCGEAEFEHSVAGKQ